MPCWADYPAWKHAHTQTKWSHAQVKVSTSAVSVCQQVPESLGLLRQRSWVAPVGWLVQVGQQCLAALLTGVVGELNGDWLGGAWWFLPIQPFNGLLSLNASVKSDETHTSRHAWTPQKCTVNLIKLEPVLWQTSFVNRLIIIVVPWPDGQNLTHRAQTQTYLKTLWNIAS